MTKTFTTIEDMIKSLLSYPRRIICKKYDVEYYINRMANWLKELDLSFGEEIEKRIRSHTWVIAKNGKEKRIYKNLYNIRGVIIDDLHFSPDRRDWLFCVKCEMVIWFEPETKRNPYNNCLFHKTGFPMSCNETIIKDIIK